MHLEGDSAEFGNVAVGPYPLGHALRRVIICPKENCRLGHFAPLPGKVLEWKCAAPE